MDLTGYLQIPNILESNGKAFSAIVNVSSYIAYVKRKPLSEIDRTEIKSMLFQSIETLQTIVLSPALSIRFRKEGGGIGEAVKRVENMMIVEKNVKITFNLG